MSRSRLPTTFPPVVQLLIVAAIIGVAFLGLFLYRLISNATAPRIVTVTPEPVPSGFFRPTAQQWDGLKFATVSRTQFPDVSDTDGTIAVADDATAQVFSPFTGRVTKVFVTTGDVVQKGAALFSGEGNEYAQAQNDLATAQQTLAAAQIQLHVTQVNRERLLKLQQRDGAVRKEVDQSRADVASALAAVKNAQTAMALARSHAAVLEATPGATPAPGARSLVTAATVRAPIGGVITQRSVSPGQFINSAANGASSPLLTISNLSRVYFVANATEVQSPLIHPGDRVAVRMQAFPGRVFDARVRYIAPSIDPNTHRLAVRAEVSNPDGSLKPGMYGSFRVYTGSPAAEIGIPEESVIFEGDTARVWVAGPNKTLALRYIRAGKTVDDMVEVLGGLSTGDRVVTRGSVFIDRASQGDN